MNESAYPAPMLLSPKWKAAIGLLCYLAGAGLIPLVLDRGIHPLFIIGGMLTLYGTYLSTVKGTRDWGDALVWIGCAIPLGVGLVLMFEGAGASAGTIRLGHLIGIGIVLVGWIPLRAQGALPGAPQRD